MHAIGDITTPPHLAKPATGTMQAIVHRQYGAPNLLRVEEVARPIAHDDEVLVRVHAAGVSIGDHHIITGQPYVIRPSIGGILSPKNRVPGTTMAGIVEAVGGRVTTLRPGDPVYGEVITGAFAEYIAVPARLLAPKPRNLSFDEAAATPWAITALQGLRDAGGLEAGHKVLINGASGGVGTWAVQIAKALGAEVTAVCSTRNAEMVRSLGADEVIDYTKVDFVTGGARFDVMLDTVGNRSIADCRSVLVPTGAFVSISGGSSSTRWLARLLWMLVSSRFTTQKLKSFIVSPNRKDLLVLNALIAAGTAKPVIERSFALRDVAKALQHIGEGHARGQTVIRIAGALSESKGSAAYIARSHHNSEVHQMSSTQVRLFRSYPLAVLALALSSAATSVLAAPDGDAPPTGLFGQVGAGAARQPTYSGSPNDRTVPVPIISINYRTPALGTFALDSRGLSWVFFDRRNLQLGVLAGVDGGRDQRRHSSDPFISGDDRLQGMGDIKSTIEVGALLAYGPVSLVARRAVDDRGHGGYVADLGVNWSFDLAPSFGVSVGASTRWADQKYMQAYYGVTSAQALASRFGAFQASQGFVSGEVSVGAEYRVTERWRLQAGLTYQQLIEEAKRSPLAEEPNSVSAFLGVAWQFN